MNSQATLTTGKSVQEVLEAAELDAEAAELVESADRLEELVQSLVEAELLTDAISILASALPEREAVGWAWVCAREAHGADPPDAVAHALDAAKAWIREPNDAGRRAAMEAAEAAGLDTPAGLAGFAVFTCGDTFGPADAHPAPPPEGIVGKIVAGCVATAAATGDPSGINERFSGFINRGTELAERIQLWGEPPATSEGDG